MLQSQHYSELRQSTSNSVCTLHKKNYLYCVLISSNLGLPWKCENTGTQNYRVIDFYILLIVDWVGEGVDLSSLKREEATGNDHAQGWSWEKGHKDNAMRLLQLQYRLKRVTFRTELTASTTALRVASMRVKPSLSALTWWYDPFWEDSWTSKNSAGKPVSIRTFWKVKITHEQIFKQETTSGFKQFSRVFPDKAQSNKED